MNGRFVKQISGHDSSLRALIASSKLNRRRSGHLAQSWRLTSAAILFAAVSLSIAFFMFSVGALASSENLRYFNDAAKKIAKRAVEAEFARGHPVCNPEIDGVSITSKGQLNARVEYSCEGPKNEHGRRRSGISVSASLRGISVNHPAGPLNTAEDFNKNQGEPWTVGKFGTTRWTHWHNGEAHRLRANHRREEGQKATNRDRYRVNIQGELTRPFDGLIADGATEYRHVGGASYAGPILLHILVSVDIWGDNLDASILNSDVLVLNIARRFLEGLDAIDAKPGVEVVDVGLLDANPKYSFDRRTFAENRKPSRLIIAEAEREGTTADGVSQLIIRAEISAPESVKFSLKNPNLGAIEPLKDGKSFTLQGKHYVFALYTPPESFDANIPDDENPAKPPEKRLGDILEVRDVAVLIEPKGGTTVEKAFVLARPPVVLVHGLFSDPIQTWINTFPDQASMVAQLERAGFLPFMVNYQETNGTEKRGSWFTDDSDKDTSSFHDNRSVVWDSPLVEYLPIKYEYGESESWLQSPPGARLGGIKQALEHYRDELKIAATQATVIGHSMGGLLARVWASDGYNKEYKRAENYGKGDIDRLLTLNTPHHGSELVELKDAIGEASISNEGWTAWARRRLTNTVIWWFLFPEPGAVTDLRPGSDALLQIGKTTVPAYAIATKAAGAEMSSVITDPHNQYNALYSAAGTAFFNNRPLLDEFVLDRFNHWENAPQGDRKDHDWRGRRAVDFSDEENRHTYRNIITQNIDSNIYYWEAQRDADFKDDMLRTLKNTVIANYGVYTAGMGNDSELDLLSPKVLLSNALTNADVTRFFDDKKVSDVPDTFLTILRDLVFHQDPETDGAVRVVSQKGSMPDGRFEVIENVVHSYSPWDSEVQLRVLNLLMSPMKVFDEEGFPLAGQSTPYYLPSAELSLARVTGDKAIAWSGMVPSHAAQYLSVADDKNVVILARPVNRSSTRLLIENAAAKGMNVKGKSANWGPQVGYIPFKQKYSKLWRIVKDPDRRKIEIAKYDKETIESTTSDHPEKSGRKFAVKRELEIETVEGKCTVVTDPEAADAEDGVYFHCGTSFYDWRNTTSNGLPAFDATAALDQIVVDDEKRTVLIDNPMTVLADGTSDAEVKPYLTADYDLLAIGFPFEQEQCTRSIIVIDGRYPDCKPAPTVGVKNAEFDKLRGYISPRQKELLEWLNDAVDKNTDYEGGLVTHHGPETQYPKSPYIDYPILVFDPAGDKPATAYLIRQGPPGFRDIHLKRLFTEKNRLGYNLWPNPVSKAWRWEERRPFDMVRGYDPRDAANLPPYVDEAPEPAESPMAQASTGGMAPPVDAGKQTELADIDETGKMQAPSEAESKLWIAMKSVGDTGALKVYLRAFPEGHYADEAKSLLQATPGEKQTSGANKQARRTTRCDELAASRWDIENNTGINVSEWKLPVHADQAIAACRKALSESPADAQSKFQLARALIAANKGGREALGLLEDLTTAGYPAALSALSHELMVGRSGPTDEPRAMRLLQEAAGKGDKFAQVSIAASYLKDIGGPADVDKAIELLQEQSAENPYSEFVLGEIFTNPDFGHPNPKLGADYLELAALHGIGPAAMRLGQLYERGEGIPADLTEALRLYNRAAELEFPGGAAAVARVQADIAHQKQQSETNDNAEDRVDSASTVSDPPPLPPSVHRCDSLAADKYDRRNLSGESVSDHALQGAGYQYLLDATDACMAAVKEFKGDATSEYQLARLLLLSADPDHLLEGRAAMNLLADEQYPAAMTAMGYLARDTDEDIAAATGWFQRAAAQGDFRAMAEIATLGLIDKMPSIDREQAILYLNESLKSDYWGAYATQSSLYYTGVYYPIDDREAAIAGVKAVRFGGRQAALHIRYKVELWNEDYRRFVQEQLRLEGFYDGAVDGKDAASTVDALYKLADRHSDANPDSQVAAPPTKAPAQQGESAESVWAVIQDNKSVAVLQAFINKFPESFYAELAKARVEELKAEK